MSIAGEITSIIPTMIFGIFLILAWFPTIIITELNNKGNDDELNILKDKLKNNLKVTDANITFPVQTRTFTLGSYYPITPTLISDNNNNLYITSSKKEETVDEKGNKSTTTSFGDELFIGVPTNMNQDNYKYLAMQKTVKTDSVKVGTTEYNITIYSIPTETNLMKVEGLKEFETELDMVLYDYEIGPLENIKRTLINRKVGANTFQMWIFRLGTFIMLAGGLMALVSPLRTLVSLMDKLPGILKIIALPGQIILGAYDALSFFGALLLTALMTLLVWTVINQPIFSILIVALIAGLSIYFNKK